MPPAAPRALVYVVDSRWSIRTTGWLEGNGIGTLRCWTLQDVRKVMRDAAPVLGVAVVDMDAADAESVIRTLEDTLADLPVVRLSRPRTTQGRHSLEGQRLDAFGGRVLEFLRTMEPPSV
jgi:hypothetical protein